MKLSVLVLMIVAGLAMPVRAQNAHPDSVGRSEDRPLPARIEADASQVLTARSQDRPLPSQVEADLPAFVETTAGLAEAFGGGGQVGPDAQGWNFDEDEEEIPTWAGDIRAQAVDLAAVSAFLVFAFVSFFRKSVALKYATLAAAVAYLGFYKSQLISIVNVFGLFGGNLPIFRQNLAWYLLTIVTVVSTVLWGRVYCGRLCAFGALTQLLDRVAPNRWQIKLPRSLERRAAFIKYGILVGAIGYFLVTRDPLIYPYIEPFWMFGLHSTTPLWLGLGVLLVASLFVRNLYCRFLCPVGAALGVLSKLTIFRIKRWSECRHCRICEKACEWGAIRGPEIVLTECVRCDDCERIYADTRKCPHHLIIIRKADILARRVARPT